MGCFAKRSPPKDVPDVSFNGVRYSVVHWAHLNGQKQNGGYVEAIDEATSIKLWGKLIYKIGNGWLSKMEEDVVDVFIKSIEISASENTLIVTNERNEKYSINLKNRNVTSLK